jgi:hypothetical protein
MFNFFKKKKEGTEELSENVGENNSEENSEEEKIEVKKETKISGNASQDLIKLSTEIEKLKAGNEAFNEVRKANTEMFTRINEQIGELRSMIFDRDRTIQTLELKATKAADLVDSVQPDKFLSILTKQSVKVEALKSNIESNEEIMERIMEELKIIRKKVDFFRGVEEIVKLSNEIKEELIEIKKFESKVRIEADKVGTIYSEMRKEIRELDAFSSDIMAMTATIEQHTKDVESLKIKMSGLAEKEEVDKILSKMTEYTRTVAEIKKKSGLSRDLEELKGLIEEIK